MTKSRSLSPSTRKQGRKSGDTPRDERTGWSTPLAWKNSQRTEIVCVGAPRVRSYDPQTGKQLWVLGGLSGQIKASPVADSDLLYVGSGGGSGFGGFGGGGRGGFRGGRPVATVLAVRVDLLLVPTIAAVKIAVPDAGRSAARRGEPGGFPGEAGGRRRGAAPVGSAAAVRRRQPATLRGQGRRFRRHHA